jgi:hypothetical protein
LALQHGPIASEHAQKAAPPKSLKKSGLNVGIVHPKKLAAGSQPCQRNPAADGITDRSHTFDAKPKP